jgi:HK97 family phage prohead protease
MAKYDHIDFVPNDGMVDEAERGLAWRRDFNRGGTEIGIARARDISNRVNLSPRTVRRMKAYFDRHEVDKEAEGFRPGEEGYPSNGRIAWALWGGDPGQTWAEVRVRQMNEADEKMSKKHKQRECKSFPAFVKQIDEDKGIVEAVVAVMGNIDYGGDIIHPGAFKKTIAENGKKVRVLDNHNAHSIMNVVGIPEDIREIGRDELPSVLLKEYPDATGGLYTKTQYLLDTPEGAGAFARIKAGAVDEYSIGYDAIKVDFDQRKDGEDGTIRNIREIKLWEYSPVIFAMNPATATLAAKSAVAITPEGIIEIDENISLADWKRIYKAFEKQFGITTPMVGIMTEQKRAIPAQDFPLAAQDHAWDGDAAEMSMRLYAGGPDPENMDWEEYRRGFTWYDAEAPELLGSYKLGVVEVIDGEPHVVPRGVFAAAGALEGARGGVDIPAVDVDGVRDTLATYYRRMAEAFEDEEIVAPWDKTMHGDEEDDEEKQVETSVMHEGVMQAMSNLHNAVQSLEMALAEAGAAMMEDEDMPDDDMGAEPQAALTPEKQGEPELSTLAKQRLAEMEQLKKELNSME